MATYDRSQALISLHIPKTAGSSLREALRGWFGEDLALHYRGDQGEPPEKIALRPGLCVHGHFNRVRGIGALDYYPQATQFIVFLREPFDRFVSQWRYLHFQQRSGVRVPDLDDHPSFEQWFDRRLAASEAGEDPFSTMAQLPWPATPGVDPFGDAYVFVGVMEHYAGSLAGLAEALGHPRPAAAHVNRASDSFRQGDPEGDYAAFRARYERAFTLEQEVYAAARKRLARAVPASTQV
jgi:hypothetical protein